jgi:hypothetical protein
MDCSNSWLPEAIRDLAAIDDDGRLSELRAAYRAECIAHGDSPAPCEEHRQIVLRTLNIGAIHQVREVARVASYMLGVPLSECERVAHDVLARNPWRDIALRLIDEYRGSGAQSRSSIVGTVGRQHQAARRRVV